MTRIVFMGSPAFAVPSLRALIDAYELVGVVTQPDRPAGRGRGLRPPAVKQVAESLGLPILQPEKASSPDMLPKLVDWRPDLIVVAAFGQILRPNALKIPKYGCVNVHASLLPRWRGAAPIQAAIAAGDHETGVTIMQMDEGMDTGPILAQRVISILPTDSGDSMTDKLALLGADLLRDSLPGYLEGEIVPRPQDSNAATKAPMLRKSDGHLEPRTPAETLARLVRAFHPWPGAYIAWRGATLKVLKAHATDVDIGTGSRGILDGLPAWGTAQGALILDEVQLAGRKPMGGRAFLSGVRDWMSEGGGA